MDSEERAMYARHYGGIVVDLIGLKDKLERRDFYELCQQYRHAQHDPVAEFEAIKNFLMTGELPWPSYDFGVISK